MPLLDITRPDVIKFLVENYDKTARLRMKWNTLNANKLQQAANFRREEKGYFDTDVISEVMAAGIAAIQRDHVVAGYNRRSKPIRDGTHVSGIEDLRKGHSITEVGLGDPKEDERLARPNTDLTIDPVMRPVMNHQTEIIYKDLPIYGRRVYLKNRSRMKPEEKYYFMECSGWEYGWRLRDSFFNKNAPKCGRVWRLTRDGKSRSGPQPDPVHYKNPNIPGPSKCEDM